MYNPVLIVLSAYVLNLSMFLLDEETSAKLAKVEVPSSGLVSGIIPGQLGMGYVSQPPFGAVPPGYELFLIWHLCLSGLLLLYLVIDVLWLHFMIRYNPAIPAQPSTWPMPPRPQPWFPAAAVPLPVPTGVAPQQPLFPIQSVRTPLTPGAPPGLQPSFPIGPPGLPSVPPAVPVSQPLFPITSATGTPSQSSPFVAASLPPTVSSAAPGEFKGVDANSMPNAAVATSTQGLELMSLCYSTATFPYLLDLLTDNYYHSICVYLKY